jgi:hypothetical protein
MADHLLGSSVAHLLTALLLMSWLPASGTIACFWQRN